MSGDGRSDSPGHCARYCTYVIMDQILKLVVDLTVLDCRETDGASTRMEKEGLVRLLKLSFLLLCWNTGHLENFNGIMLKYVPERNAFKYQYYRDRMYLAAVDHNVHILRERMKSKRTGNRL